MAPAYTKKSLEALPRAELQKLCKTYGIKANMKTEVLVDMLVDAAKRSGPLPAPTLVVVEAPLPAPARQRAVSTRQSARTNQKRVGSMIIHSDDDNEEEHEQEKPEPKEPTPPPAHTAPAPRTQKAKAQLRLGVGRPQIAGGSGARDVTKSVSVSKGKRGRGSKSIKAVEETIPEEDDLSPSPEDQLLVEPQPQPETSAKGKARAQTSPKGKQVQVSSSPNASNTQAEVERLTEKLGAVLGEVDTLKGQVQTLIAEVALLKEQAAAQKGRDEAENEAVKALEDDALRVRQEEADEAATREAARMQEDDGGIARPTTPTPVSRRSQSPTKGLGSSIRGSSSTPAKAPRSSDGRARSQNPQSRAGSSTRSLPPPSMERHPGIAASTLGKHQRDAVGEMSGLIEEGEEETYSQSELAHKVVVPSHKRAKIATGTASGGKRRARTPAHDPHAFTIVPSKPLDEDDEDHRVAPPRNAAAGPSFNVFSGPDHMESYNDAPPTSHLPDYFSAPSPPPDAFNMGPGTSSSQASENQPRYDSQFGGFGFGTTPQYLPVSTNPGFSYMEPPQSPAPAQLSGLASGAPSPFNFGRTGSAGSFVTPAMLRGGGSGPGMSMDPSGQLGPSEPVAPAKRTMYGTELDADSRFGDFGSGETGFWTGNGRF